MSESLTWVKSSYSSTGNCVEAAGQPGRVLIRDTKNQSGPVLSTSAEAWRRFTAQVKRSLAAAPVWSQQPPTGALSQLRVPPSPCCRRRSVPGRCSWPGRPVPAVRLLMLW